MKELDELELRMYFFVPYNISEIAKGIQAGHSALRYARQFSSTNPKVWDFVDNHETWIILNGGTTNDELDFNGIPKGTLNQIGDKLNENDIEFSYFREPDLNNGLTALCFILDERVFNTKDYPDFQDFLIERGLALNTSNVDLISTFDIEYKEWVRMIGGIKNIFLRELIKGKKLA